jgi:hypothetical protein
VPKLAQTLPECVGASQGSGRGGANYESYPRNFRWLLRVGEMNKSEGQECDESSYSCVHGFLQLNSSARAVPDSRRWLPKVKTLESRTIFSGVSYRRITKAVARVAVLLPRVAEMLLPDFGF